MEEVKERILRLLRDPALRLRSLGLALLALSALYLRKVIRFFQWRRDMLNRFPGPKPSLLLGNIGDIVRISGGFEEAFYEWLHAKHGPVVGFYLGPAALTVSFTDPEHAYQVYKQTRSRPHETYMFLHYLGKDNLLFSHGEDAKQMRLRYGKMITNKAQLLKLHDLSMDEFTKRARSWGSQKSVDLFSELSYVVYDVMGRMFFGRGWLETETGPEIYRLHKYLIQNTNKYMIPGASLLLFPSYIEYVGVKNKWRKLCNDLLDIHEKKLEENPKAFENDQSAMTMLLTAKTKEGKPFFTRHRMVSTMCGFLNGAFDTTHATSYWLFYHLAKHQDVQEKLKKQIRKVVGSRTDATLEEAREIEYLQAVIYESMRLKTTVPINQRVNYEEDIQIGEYTIPKGVSVFLPMCITMRNREYFGDDVDEFRPERFMPQDPFYKKAKFAWSAFGLHSRMCIGFTFALVELKALLLSVVQQYRVEFADEESAGLKMYEAGVAQPKDKAQFRFVPSSAQLEAEQENLQWWQRDTKKSSKPGFSTAA